MIFTNNHISITSSQLLTDICKSMFDNFSITFFDYARNYYDNTHVYLSTHPELTKLMFNEKHHVNVPCFKHPAKYEYDYMLWDAGDDRYAGFKFEQMVKEKFDVAHFLNFVVRGKNYTEIFSFAGSFSNRALNGIYLSQQQVFRHFVMYFYDKAELLLKQAEKERLYIPYANSLIHISDDELMDLTQKQMNGFISRAPINNIHLSGDFSNIVISSREAACIKLLLEDASYKHIARRLGISPRTVEARLDKLRDKLNCKNKRQLIEILQHPDIKSPLQVSLEWSFPSK